MGCLEARNFKKKEWGRYYCLLINQNVEILRGKCIESGCPRSNALPVIRRRAISRDVLPHYNQKSFSEDNFSEGIENVLGNPWWED